MDKETDRDIDETLSDIKNLVENAENATLTVAEILSDYHNSHTPIPRKKRGEPEKSNHSNTDNATQKEPINIPLATWVDTPIEAPAKTQTAVDPEPEQGQNIIPFSKPKLQKAETEALDALFGMRTVIPIDQKRRLAQENDGTTVSNAPDDTGVVSALIKGIRTRADDYAEHMFEEEVVDVAEVRRIEKLIPGTDEEDEVPYVPSRRRQEPPPPDTSPSELERRYSRGLGGMKLRCFLLFLLTICGLIPLLLPMVNLVLPPQLTNHPSTIIWVYTGGLGAGILLSIDVLYRGFVRGLRLKVGMDTLVLLACIATMLDGLFLSYLVESGGRIPYHAINILALWLLVYGEYHKRCGLRISCRIAATAKEPYRVTLDEKKWSGRDTYCKWAGTSEGFGSQIQIDDGAQRIYKAVCPLLLLGAVLCGGYIGLRSRNIADVVWALSGIFTATSALGSATAYGRVSRKLAKRLANCGAALAGWGGIVQSRRGDRVLLTDTDLFPTGYVQFKQPHIMKGYAPERVIAYCASIFQYDDNGLTSGFYDLLRRRGGTYRRVEKITYYEGGGASALIRHDKVLVGTASFMNLMEVELPTGLQVNQAIFCAINGELAGIFALKYAIQDSVYPSIYTLLGEKIAPILATRDFSLIPSMLAGRFKLPADEMDFPAMERRRELSDPDAEHSEILTAILCREGLAPFAEAVVSARRLRISTRVAALICCFGSALGLLLSSYLTLMGAHSSLSPLNLLVFLITWLIPVWCVSEWGYRF